MNKNIISAPKKAQILAELALPGCEVSKVAKTYNVSTTSIYSLRKEAAASSVQHNFVEIADCDSQSAAAILQKATLAFENFSLHIDGKFKTSSLISIIEILENEAC